MSPLSAPPGFWDAREGQRLDDFCRNAMQQGLIYHEEQSRGYLPSGLVEEIRALGHPAIKWDVELARWFDHYFAPLEKKTDLLPRLKAPVFYAGYSKAAMGQLGQRRGRADVWRYFGYIGLHG